MTRAATPDALVDLRHYLSGVADPRKRRGVRHPLVLVLTILAAAVTAGSRSFTAIGEWPPTPRNIYSRY